MSAASTTPVSTSVPSKEKESDWADVSDDDDEEESAATVKVDSLDLTSLSLQDKTKAAPTGVPWLYSAHLLGSKPAAKSLADRISSGELTTDKKGEDKYDKEGTIAPPLETKVEEKNTKERETNLIQNKYEVAVKLQDLQADPNSPLYSVKSFEELGL